MMEIGSIEWVRLVQEGASQLGVAVTPSQAEQFARHGQWMLAWNRKINLTAIIDPKAVAIKHFVDAIAPLHHIPDEGHLLDIGTGGGFPGIPLKIMRPRQPMTLIDSVRKKINFVKHVIRQMALNNIEALHTRAETLLKAGGQGRYSVIVCRALADMTVAVELAAPLLSASGSIVVYQGRQGIDDSADPANCRVVVGGQRFQHSVISYPLPFLGDSRSVAILTLET